MKTSVEMLEEIIQEINQCASLLEANSEGINQGAAAAARDWNDNQGQSFVAAMRSTAQLVEEPVETLRATVPKLEELVEIVKTYSTHSFD